MLNTNDKTIKTNYIIAVSSHINSSNFDITFLYIISIFIYLHLHFLLNISYGISEEMIRDSQGKGARNAIIGTYRIVCNFHCIIRQNKFPEFKSNISYNLVIGILINLYLQVLYQSQGKNMDEERTKVVSYEY